MKRPVRKLRLAAETVRQLRSVELQAARGGLRATSESVDTWPCPGEYSYFCKP